jgi:hypothetical protein
MIESDYYDVIKVIIIIIIINEFKFQLNTTKTIIRPGNVRRDISRSVKHFRSPTKVHFGIAFAFILSEVGMEGLKEG